MATTLAGKVLKLTTYGEGVLIMLDNEISAGPKDNFFRLLLTTANYNSLYSLALAAAANRWTINIKVLGEIDINPQLESTIKTLRVEW